MEYIEVSAKTIDDALTEASIKLGTTSDKLEYEVIDIVLHAPDRLA